MTQDITAETCIVGLLCFTVIVGIAVFYANIKNKDND